MLTHARTKMQRNDAMTFAATDETTAPRGSRGSSLPSNDTSDSILCIGIEEYVGMATKSEGKAGKEKEKKESQKDAKVDDANGAAENVSHSIVRPREDTNEAGESGE